MSAPRPDWLDRLVDASRGATAQDISRIAAPPDVEPRESAVLIALSEDDRGPGVLLIERAATLRTHAGQTAFPGGAADPGDADPAATALREASEEVGLDPATVEIVVTLPELFLPPSRFLVTPVVAWWHDPHPIGVVDANEVARAVVVPVAELVDPANRFRVMHPSGFTGPGFQAGGLFIWGFTAGLLRFILELGGWSVPWDETALRELPAQVTGAGTVTP
jgi:8-oxo-dGTP pyrophosphatase MutT (NUDIX family)